MLGVSLKSFNEWWWQSQAFVLERSSRNSERKTVTGAGLKSRRAEWTDFLGSVSFLPFLHHRPSSSVFSHPRPEGARFPGPSGSVAPWRPVGELTHGIHSSLPVFGLRRVKAETETESGDSGSAWPSPWQATSIHLAEPRWPHQGVARHVLGQFSP